MKVGIVFSFANEEVLLNQAYVTYFRQFGEVILIDPANQNVQDVDLLVLPGGADVNPLNYNEFPHALTGKPNLAIEYFDKFILPKYIESNTPIFGICRGLIGSPFIA